MKVEACQVDVDNVLADCDTVLRELLAIHLHRDSIPFNHEWNFQDIEGITHEMVKMVVGEFQRYHLLHVSPITGAVDAMDRLSSKYKIIICTNRNSEIDGVVPNTTKWLEKHGIKFDELLFNDGPKVPDIYTRYVIDDSLTHINKAAEFQGVTPILFEYPWSKASKASGSVRVATFPCYWDEALSHVAI